VLKGLLVAIVVLLAGTGSAHAAMARVAGECDKYECSDFVVFEAAAGERNVLSTEVAGLALIVRDAGATITAGNGCVAIADGVSCVASDDRELPPGMDAFLGDGDDVSTANADVFGGRGDDRLTGTGGLSGGPGDDVLTGSGPFFDDDGATPGHDVYRGSGGEFEHLYYTGRADGVRVDLRPGRRSEDRISGIRDVTGGSGDDVLIGDDEPDGLDGAGGRDRLRGLGGDDVLSTGRNVRGGPDVVDAGPGDDEIEAGSGSGRLRCGPGEDSVSAGRGDVLTSDCDWVASGPGDKVRLRGTLPYAGAAFLRSIPFCEQCSADRWRAKARGRTVATVAARTRPARLRLNAAGRRLLRRDRTLTLNIERRFVIPPPPDTAVSGFTISVRLR
jgi:hypothetical protein